MSYAQLNTERILAIGRNALFFNDYVLSIQYFNQIIKIKPYLAEPYMYRAIAKIQLGDYNGAAKDCEEVIKRNPFLPGAYYIRGFIYRENQSYESAEEDFTKALEFAPGNKSYIINRADVRQRQKKYDDAEEDIKLLLAKEPNAADLYYELGKIQLAKQDTTTAANTFERVVRIIPQEASAWSALGYIRLLQSQNDSALICFDKAIELGSKWAGDFLNRGVLHYKHHNYRNALADYDKAIQLSPDDPQGYYNRGSLRSQLGDHNKALNDFQQVLELTPDNMEGRYQHGIVSLELRDWEVAISDFDSIINRHPYFLPAYYLAARAHMELGNTKQAFTYQNKANELEKDKDIIQQQRKARLNTDVKVASSRPTKNKRKEFSSRAAQNIEDYASEYTSEIRGSVQKQYVDVIHEPNFEISYYAKSNSLRQSNYYHPSIDDLRKVLGISQVIKITNQSTSLDIPSVEIHFDAINRLTDILKNNSQNPYTYFQRALEFSLIQDHASAIEDLNKSIILDSELALAYFCRAYIRYNKLLYEFQNNQDQEEAVQGKIDKVKINLDLIQEDYERTLALLPSFSFAHFNLANLLCAQKHYDEAIKHYESAIQIDHDFAEAYFNLGLTYIYIDKIDKGIELLGKAGELGIYQAYNLISRLR